MNRIYQGRVTKVEIFDGKDTESKTLNHWQVLWQHRELFSDTVNFN